MTRELCERIIREFPVVSTITVGKFTLRQSYEQPRLKYIGPGFRKPILEEIRAIAETTLKRVKRIYQIPSEVEVIQGAGKDDIVVIPGYQGRTQHALVVADMDYDGRTIIFQSSWHAAYHMTPKQIERYIAFAKIYFKTFAPKKE